MQKAITKVAEKSQCHKVTLNASALLTNKSKEARCQYFMQHNESPFNTAQLPNLFGVTFDRPLSFGPHVAAVVSKDSNKC